jgi:endonuclease/exonuclease/phosphatase (EEP) superfamily protein YafD
VLIGLALAGYALRRIFGRLRPWEYGLVGAAGLALVWQLAAIAPYTPLHPKEMSDSPARDGSNRLSLLIYNVLAENREVEALRALIRETDPDIILLSEPNQWWLDQLEGLDDDYPYTLFQPQENQYGKLLYSRLELIDPEIRFLIDGKVPSLRSRVRLRSGKLITFHGAFPRGQLAFFMVPTRRRTPLRKAMNHKKRELTPSSPLLTMAADFQAVFITMQGAAPTGELEEP